MHDLIRNGWPSARVIRQILGQESLGEVRNNAETSGQPSQVAVYEATIPQEPLPPPSPSPPSPPQPQPAVDPPHQPIFPPPPPSPVPPPPPPPPPHLLPAVPPPLPLARQPFNQNWTVHYLGKMDVACPDCGALHWMSEQLVNSPKFGMCCYSGKIKIPKLDDPPPELLHLLSGQEDICKKFRDRIHNYNNALAMTSLGCD